MNTLDIIEIFKYVCDDCIGIIMDYIDTPHDILKLIYYNKYYLYDIKNNEGINKTTNSVQLLLYKKFSEKMMNNMKEYVNRSDIDWPPIIELLDETTILSGGFVLQSIYGKINETTEIPLDFYYKEYAEINKELNSYSLKHFINQYKTKKTTTVCTDLDIFKVTPTNIFNSNSVIEYYECSHADLYYTLYRTKHNSNVIIIHIFNIYGEIKIDDFHIVYDDFEKENHNSKCIYSDKLINAIKNENCDIYVEIYVSPDSVTSLLLNTNNITSPTNCNQDERKKYYKVLNNKILCDKPITKKNIFNSIRNTPTLFLEQHSGPLIAENCKVAHSDECSRIKEHLINNGDMLLKKIKNIRINVNNVTNYKFTSPKSYSSYTTTYDSLEDTHRSHSKFDSYCHYDNILSGHCPHESLDGSYQLIFNSDMEKKIVPITHSVGFKLLLNLVYINPHFFVNSKDFINKDFDINICRQSFDGKKIMLHSIGDLVHKRFRYDINHIINNNKNNGNKYISFRKRIEKYKTRGFTCLDEKQIVNQAKNLLGIKLTNKIVQDIQNNFKNCSVIKKYYYDVILQNNNCNN